MTPTGTNLQQAPAIATPWGVEELGRAERFAKGVEAGLDQFGGTGRASCCVDAVKRGLVQEARLDESVRRVMILKFRQGLFDNPFVDAAKAASLVGSEAVSERGRGRPASRAGDSGESRAGAAG